MDGLDNTHLLVFLRRRFILSIRRSRCSTHAVLVIGVTVILVDLRGTLVGVIILFRENFLLRGCLGFGSGLDRFCGGFYRGLLGGRLGRMSGKVSAHQGQRERGRLQSSLLGGRSRRSLCPRRCRGRNSLLLMSSSSRSRYAVDRVLHGGHAIHRRVCRRNT